MAYEFDPFGSATLADLRELVAAQSFSLQRYGSLLDTWLNDGVLEVCKRLNIIHGAEILDFDAGGLVAQPERSFFRVREAWACDPPVATAAIPTQSVRLASTGNVVVDGPGLITVIDGVTLAAGDRLLLKNQTNPAENGIYDYDYADGVLAGRASDMNSWTEVHGALVFVAQGASNVGTSWACTSAAGGTLGTTAIIFAPPPGPTGTDENAVRLAARYKLVPCDHLTAGRFSPSTQPWGYSARRGVAAGGRHVPVAIRVTPAGQTGKVGIIGQQRPPIMAGDTDPTGLGADLDDAVVSWAKARAFRQEDDFEMSAAWRAEFEAALTTAATSPVDDGPVITPGIEDC
jgi:hypothetical protein